MEFHICKNCCLIDQIIANKIKKYDALSEENVKLHNTVIKLENNLSSVYLELANLQKGLDAEREHNLQLYMQQQINKLNQSFVNIVQEKPKSRNGKSINSASGTELATEKQEYVALSKYNLLLNLTAWQKEVYEANSLSFQMQNDNRITKLNEQLNYMRERNSALLTMYKSMRNDLFEEKKENIERRILFENYIDTIQGTLIKHTEESKKEIAKEAAAEANAHLKETLKTIKFQLERRDKLIALLRQQLIKLETHAEKQSKEHYKQQQQYKEVVDGLKRQLKAFQEKYSVLDKRRALEGEGFRTDITNIRKDLKQLKRDLSKTAQTYEYCEIQNLQNITDVLEEKVEFRYSRPK